jgi:glycerate 2-kinase
LSYNSRVKIVVALDKFKGSLPAPRACEIVRDTLLSMRPEWRVVTIPMADGGDGTAEVLHGVLGGRWFFRDVAGPLPELGVRGTYLWIDEERTAVIESASASGLAMLKPEQRNPLMTTTLGTGELIQDAIERGAQKILLGVGGSATIDGGVGAAMALGWRFLDAHGDAIGLGGGELERIARMERPARRTDVGPAIDVLCDVDNPLCGEHGAARVFGPQKGATAAMVERLDAGLKHLAALAQEQLGIDIANVPGAGAAGGLAAGAMAFMDGRLVSGAEAIIRETGLEGEIAGADWVVTGEGRFDEQSLRGKVVSGVTRLATKHGGKVAVLAGSVQVPENIWRREGIRLTLATMKPEMDLVEAMAHAEELLAATARELATQIAA